MAKAMARKRSSRSKPARRSSRPRTPSTALAAGLPAYLQRKMQIGRAGDEQEQEADQAAENVAKQGKDEEKKPLPTGGQPEEEQVQAKAKEVAEPEVTEEQPEAEVQQKLQRAEEEKPEETDEPKIAEKAKEEAEPEVRKKSDGPTVRRKASGPGPIRRTPSGGGVVSGDVEDRIDQARGRGEPLPQPVQRSMESSFGRDFSGVRTHTDDSAQTLSEDLNAQAFAVGNDIFFNTGKFAPETPRGKHLLAHELTHVVQQGGGGGGGGPARRQVIQREAETKEDFEGDAGSIRFGGGGKGELRINEIAIPKFKADFMPAKGDGYEVRSEARDTAQSSAWKKFVKAGADGMNKALDDKLASAPKVKRNQSELFYVKVGGTDQILSGTKSNLRKFAITPTWNEAGAQVRYDIDHKLENQVGGGDSKENLWLLESRANQDSGRKVYQGINDGIAGVLTEARDEGHEVAADVASARAEYKILVLAAKGSEDVDGNPDENYTVGEVQGGSSIKPLKSLSKTEITQMQGSPDQLVIMSRSGRGKVLRVPWSEDATSMPVKQKFMENFDTGTVTYEKGKGGSITGTAFKQNKVLKPVQMNLPFKEDPVVEWGGSLVSGSIPEYLAGQLDAKGMSPVKVEEAGIDEGGIYATGQLQISVPMLQGVTADFQVRGNDVVVSKTFSKGDFKSLGPIKVTGSSLTLKVGTMGLGADGEVSFEIEKMGEGTVRASAATKGQGGSFSLEGEFNVEQDLFEPAKVTMKYAGGKFSGSGNIGIKPGKIKGIKSATAQVKVDGDAWSASGSVKPDVPGVEQADLGVAYSKETGLEIGGELQLAKIKGLNGGKITVEVVKAGDDWKAKGKGDAQLAIPGLTKSSVSVSYDDGLFEATAELGYKKGMLDGTLEAGVTNRPVGEDGKPGGDPGTSLTIFGTGTVTLQIAPWLQGTIGVTLKPDGGIKVRGKIGLPGTVDLFPEKTFDKNLVSVGFDIPIIGVAVAGQRIGVFLTVGGGLDLSAGVGPGQLRELELGVDYDPDNEDATTVTGSALFVIPAHAGLRLSVHAGLGAGIPIVSASAGLEVAGEVGLKGEAKASAQVDWSPKKGLALHAEGDVSVSPKFLFSVNGYCLVEADLLVKTIELYRKNWNLASVEYGSNLEFGVSFPIDYKEGEAFSLSMDDMKFRTPDVDPKKVLSGIVDKIK